MLDLDDLEPRVGKTKSTLILAKPRPTFIMTVAVCGIKVRPGVRGFLVMTVLAFLPLGLYVNYFRFGTKDNAVQEPGRELFGHMSAYAWHSQSNDTNVTMKTFEEALLESADSKGYIILASVDFGFVDMAINLYETSLKKFGIENYLFVCSDTKAAEILDAHGISNYNYFKDKDGGEPSSYRSDAFARKTHYKTKIVLDALKLHLTVLLTDVDIVFLKNPFPHLTCDSCDLQFSSDVIEENSGFYLVRPTKAAIELHQKAWDGGMANPKKSNQKQIDTFLRDMLKKKTIKRHMLSLKTFPCGVVYFDKGQRMFAGDNPCRDCVIVHNNWIVSGPGKIYRFKEHLMWLVNDGEYYSSSSRRYFTYGNPVDFGAKYNLGKETQALKTALAIGHVLNRTLILPSFHCDPCKEPDSPCKNPQRRCALNSFYKMIDFDREFGGMYREHVFLRHELVPENVKNSQSNLILIDTSAGGPVTIEDNSIRFTPSNMTTGVSRKELISWLATEAFANTSVLRFHSLYGRWTELLKSDVEFEKKLSVGFTRATYRQFKV